MPFGIFDNRKYEIRIWLENLSQKQMMETARINLMIRAIHPNVLWGSHTKPMLPHTISNRFTNIKTTVCQLYVYAIQLQAKKSNDSDKFMLLCLPYNFQNHWIGIILPLDHLWFFLHSSSLWLNMIADSALTQHLAKSIRIMQIVWSFIRSFVLRAYYDY